MQAAPGEGMIAVNLGETSDLRPCLSSSGGAKQVGHGSSTVVADTQSWSIDPGFASACGNFSIQYNYSCASIAAIIMLSHNDSTSPGIPPDFPQPLWAHDTMLSVVFIGSMIGMLSMGYLGDLVGYDRALIVTHSFTVVGALMSALLPWGGPGMTWGMICFGRFVIGIGVGGTFPLSAATAAKAEGAVTSDMSVRVGRAFFWQNPGCAAPYMLAMTLLFLPRANGVTSLQFRLLLGAGAVPALMVLLPLVFMKPNPAVRSTRRHDNGTSFAQVLAMMQDSSNRRSLIGCAASWFLYDVAAYGMMVFAPSILLRVFGEQETITHMCLHAIVMISMGALGTLIGLMALPFVGNRVLNTWGFVIMAALFCMFSLLAATHPEQHVLMFGLLCLLFAASSMGPGLSTFILPLEVFPHDVRSSFHGICAAAGKLGAVAATLTCPVLQRMVGVPGVMFAQSLVCCVAALVSCIYLGGQWPERALLVGTSKKKAVGFGACTSQQEPVVR